MNNTMSIEEFCELSPRELYREFEIGMRRRRDEMERDITLAWRIAMLQRQERIPELRTLLPRQKQSPAALVTALQVISEQYGIPIRRTRKEP